MDAVTVVPGQARTTSFQEIPEPDPSLGSVLVEAIAVGVCGTDVEITNGSYGWAPPGRERLVLGHESIGRVLDPGSSGFSEGDHVVGIVRRPDPVPCPNCSVGEWDMCSNGGYTERGIKEIDGFMSQRWRIEPEYAVPVEGALGILGVLLEPTTVVAKAWEQILAIGQRTFWEPETVLVVGAGPIGLLAALLGVQHGFDVHVLDRVTSGPKPDLVRDLGAPYHTGRSRTDPPRSIFMPRIGGARRGAGRDSLSLPHGYHERCAVAGCVRFQQRDGGCSGIHVVAALVYERRSQRWGGRRCLCANPKARRAADRTDPGRAQ